MKVRLWRAIVDGCRCGALNMAVDEAMMLCQGDGVLPPTIRVYGWSPPCISLGYFQRAEAEIDLQACAASGVDIVRRPTGGRAVLHEDEVTYSLVVPQEAFPGSILETYRGFSAGLVQALAYLGVQAELARPARRRAGGRAGGRAGPRAGRDDAPGPGAAGDAACFDSPSWYELLCGGRKIAGSAQTRHGGVILQHGSLLVGFDAARLARLLRCRTSAGRARLESRLQGAATAITRQIGRRPAPGEVQTALICGMARALGVEIVKAGFAREELELTRELYHNKYKNTEWTFRR